MQRVLKTQVVLTLIWVILSGIALGQVPQLINYQGVLVDPGTGQPVPDNTYSITFSIYDVASGGSSIWTETQSVQTKDGLYSALLGSTTPLTPTILSGPEKYLGIKVGSDPEMTPRKRIDSVAYAHVAESVSGASNVFTSEGNVGIGIKIPLSKLHIKREAENALQLPLRLVNPDGTDTGGTATGILFQTQNGFGKGALVYERKSGWGRGDFHFLQNTVPDESIPTLSDSVVTIRNNGNVGIGLASPAYKLDVAGDINFTGSLYQNGNPFSGGSLWSQNGNNIFYNNGYVGIGTPTPENELHVKGFFKLEGSDLIISELSRGDGGRALVHTGDGSGTTDQLILNFAGDFEEGVKVEGSKLVVDSKVGIGNASPTHTLDIAGKIGINDTQVLYLPDQNDFRGTLYLGDGGGSLSHISEVDGYYNNAMGIGALYSNTTGHYNTASGFNALYSNTTGHNNTAIGYWALYNNTTGHYNTASGYEALYRNTGQYNTASGCMALYLNTTGHYNTASGYKALDSNTTGNRNTAIGAFADVVADNLENATAIGYGAGVNASNKVVIGDGLVTVIGGYVNWSNLSDGRFKHSVREDIKGLDFITRLRPVSYQMDVEALNAHLAVKKDPEHEYVSNSNKADIVYSGFIGQEVEAAAREVGYDFSGVVPPQNEKDHYSLRYAEFVVPLVKAVQEQQKIIEDLQNEVAALKKKLGE